MTKKDFFQTVEITYELLPEHIAINDKIANLQLMDLRTLTFKIKSEHVNEVFSGAMLVDNELKKQENFHDILKENLLNEFLQNAIDKNKLLTPIEQ